MKIGVISDTHGSSSAWKKAMDKYFYDADLIIHAGDVLYHGPRNPMPEGYNPAGLAELINNSPAPVLIARGNCDADVDQLLIDYPIQSPYTFLQFEGVRILTTHGDKFNPMGGEFSLESVAALSEKYKARVTIFGHIHLPVLEVINGAVVFNPGSASLPKEAHHPTIGIIDDQGISIIELDNNEVIKSYKWEA